MNLWTPDCPCLFHPLCKIRWKPGCLCIAVCLCPSHLISVPTPCLECVHASVHVFVSIGLPMLAKPSMDSYMETWVPLYGNVCVFQSPWFWSLTLIKMCTCITVCIHVHMATHVCFTLFEWLYENLSATVWQCVCVSQSPWLWFHTLIKMCTCINTCIHVHLTPHVPFV